MPDRAAGTTPEAHLTRAHALILYADGLQAAGQTDYAHRARDVARDVLELDQQLSAERSARQAIQERNERLQAIIGRAAYHAADDHAFADIPWPDA